MPVMGIIKAMTKFYTRTGDDGTIGCGADEPIAEGMRFEAHALLADLNRPPAGAVLSVVVAPVIKTGAVGIG